MAQITDLGVETVIADADYVVFRDTSATRDRRILWSDIKANALAGFPLLDGTRAFTGAQTFSAGIVTATVRPLSDSTTAFRVQNAAGNRNIFSIDTVSGAATLTDPTDSVGGSTLNVGEIRLSGLSFARVGINIGDGGPFMGYNLKSVGASYLHDSTGAMAGIAYNNNGIHFLTNSNLSADTVAQEVLTVLTTVRFGFGAGNTTPTALVDLAASNTARASLRIREAAAILSDPNSGDVWFPAGGRLTFRRATTTEIVATGVTGTGAAATAGASYTSAEQAMLQAVYNAARNFGLLN